MSLRHYFPILEWGRCYQRADLVSDGVAAVIVTIMLIPQSLAYALLAGVPLQAGLYASVVPLLLYALLGSSYSLAVGPVAVVSLMTAGAIGGMAATGSHAYWQIALTLAFLSGVFLFLLGLLRLGFLAHFLSHPVVSGFISASGILIAASQVKVMMGVKVTGDTFFPLVFNLIQAFPHSHFLSLAIGVLTVVFLLWGKQGFKPFLSGRGTGRAAVLGKLGPIVVIVITTILSWWLGWGEAGLKLTGEIPRGLPQLTAPLWDWALWQQLLLPAVLIAVVGFVESVSVGQTLAARRRQRISPNQELLALGASNVGASFSGGFPVTGGLSRSAVNFDAGAKTPAAGAFTAVGIALAALYLTPALYYLPQTTLAATIVVAVLSLIDFSPFKKTWHYAKSDFFAIALTFGLTLLVGVEIGLVAGVSASLLLFLYHTSQPHIAEVGRVAGSEHFRNVLRHKVITDPRLLSLRVDESLYFANVPALEDWINRAVALRPQLQYVVLQCSAINAIDASALASLLSINQRLADAGITFHLSEVKGPVMDRLKKTNFLQALSGQVFLSHHQALTTLQPPSGSGGAA